MNIREMYAYCCSVNRVDGIKKYSEALEELACVMNKSKAECAEIVKNKKYPWESETRAAQRIINEVKQ